MKQFIQNNRVYAALIIIWSFVTILVIGQGFTGNAEAIDFKIIVGFWLFLGAVSLKSPYVRATILYCFYRLLAGKQPRPYGEDYKWEEFGINDTKGPPS